MWVLLLPLAFAQLPAPDAHQDLRTAVCTAKPQDLPCDAWTLGAVHFGAFQSPNSEDALVTLHLTPAPRRYSTLGLLLTRRNRAWQVLDEPVLALSFDSCRPFHRADRRHVLVCFSEDHAESTRYQTVRLIQVKDAAITIQVLAEAGDRASLDRLSFPDLNRDGRPDLRIQARHSQAHYRLEFLFDGTTFAPTRASLPALRHFLEKER